MIQLLHPSKCFPPHGVGNPEHRDQLLMSLLKDGWDLTKYPALVGYQWADGYQLLSGSHRYSACELIDMRMPVEVVDFMEVWDAYGDTEKWALLMKKGHQHLETVTT